MAPDLKARDWHRGVREGRGENQKTAPPGCGFQYSSRVVNGGGQKTQMHPPHTGVFQLAGRLAAAGTPFHRKNRDGENPKK
jgi:hypothetical protein